MIRLLSTTAAALAALVLAAPAGATTFQSPLSSPATGAGSPGWIDLAAADLDRDGTSDLVATDEGQAKYGRLMSNGDGTFTLYETPLAGAVSEALSVGRL